MPFSEFPRFFKFFRFLASVGRKCWLRRGGLRGQASAAPAAVSGKRPRRASLSWSAAAEPPQASDRMSNRPSEPPARTQSPGLPRLPRVPSHVSVPCDFCSCYRRFPSIAFPFISLPLSLPLPLKMENSKNEKSEQLQNLEKWKIEKFKKQF